LLDVGCVTSSFGRTPSAGSQSGFTLTEAVVALSIVTFALGSFISGMTKLNEQASVSRNATGAAAVLQNQVDLMLSHGPFNPQKFNEDGSVQIPPELTVGTHVTNNVAIYREQSTGVIVSGTLTTTISDVSQVVSGMKMWLYQANITLNYVYRGKAYTSSRSTIRTSDI
jgi:type II secretory pathway pseudopilin PulG